MGCVPVKNETKKPVAPTSAKQLQKMPTIELIEEEVLKSGVATHYKFLKGIGKGGMGKVYLCKKGENDLYAVQHIIKSKIGIENTREITENFHTLQEIENNHIIKFYELFEEGNSLYIVMEYCSGGELFDKILSANIASEKECAKIIIMLLQALDCLHSKNIVHLDIKPQNIMFASTNANSQVKLIDFNLCKYKEKGTIDYPNGTPQFMAPEMIDGNYSTESDMWSLGVVLYILLSGEFPFWGDTHEQLYKEIRECKLFTDPNAWKSVSSDAKDLIQKLIVVDPTKRLSAKGCLGHPWIKNLHKCKNVINPDVKKNLNRFNLSNKLHRAVKEVLYNEDLAKLLPKLADKIENEGNNRTKISVKELIDLLNDAELQATKDQIQHIISVFNKSDSECLHVYDIFNKVDTPRRKRIDRMYSCNDTNLIKSP